MNTKFTPGPWAVEPQESSYGTVTMHCIIVDSPDGWDCVASTWAGPHLSNAHLIAAAPRLYAAVQLAIKLVDDDIIRVRDGGREKLLDALEEWNETLAEARGETA